MYPLLRSGYSATGEEKIIHMKSPARDRWNPEQLPTASNKRRPELSGHRRPMNKLRKPQHIQEMYVEGNDTKGV
jgi:hypothetical protein